MLLSNKTDSEILEGLTVWVGKEREAASYVLHYLQEVEDRKLYLNNASSLREFCMKVHKYSRQEAQTRVDAMRLMKTVPEIDQDIDAGRLSLTVAAQLQSAFRQEDERRKKAGKTPLTEDEQKAVLSDLMSASTREADRKLATHFPEQPPKERTKPLSQELTRIEFNVNSMLLKKFERLMTVYHHQTGGKWEKLFEILADHEIEKLDAPPRRARGLKVRSTKTRYVSNETNQQVWAEWERGCTHILDNGEACGSRQNLQKDHIIEFSQGGGNERANLTLVCGPHNRFRSDRRQLFRDECMKRFEEARDAIVREPDGPESAWVSLSSA